MYHLNHFGDSGWNLQDVFSHHPRHHDERPGKAGSMLSGCAIRSWDKLTLAGYLKVHPELHEATLDALSAMDSGNHANGNANSGVVGAVGNA